jgi:hypothetical protein
MLSLSADINNADVNLQMINGDETATDGGVLHAKPLMKFAEALALRDEQALAQARQDLLETAGPQVLVDAACIAGNFQRMVRIADATGIPLDPGNMDMSTEVRAELDFMERFDSARNTPRVTLIREPKGQVLNRE